MTKNDLDYFLKIAYPNIVEHVKNLMEDNDKREKHKDDDWEKRYKNYLKLISPNNDKITRIKKLQSAIHIEKPLTKYLSISYADKTSTNKVVYDVRVYGHSIGNLIIHLDKNINEILNKASFLNEDKKRINKLIKNEKREFVISETNYHALNKLCEYFPDSNNNELKKWVEKNKENFLSKPLKWNGDIMSELRNIFKKSKDDLKIGSEHSCENLLLRKFAEKDGDKKYIKNIQPVKIANCGFFQMPTCLSCSKSKAIKYSGGFGGGIDILTKIKKGGNKPSELCVIELKDEYKTIERPVIAMKQAISYAVCLDYILRSPKINTPKLNWYQILTGSTQNIKDSININVVVAMPFENGANSKKSISAEDFDLANQVLPIEVYGFKDTLTLHYMFFKKEALKNEAILNGIITSLPINHNFVS